MCCGKLCRAVSCCAVHSAAQVGPGRWVPAACWAGLGGIRSHAEAWPSCVGIRKGRGESVVP